MAKPAINRRQFNCESLISLLSAVAATSVGGAASARRAAAEAASTRRDVIKQELPGQPLRDLSLVELTYPPGAGSPAHLHVNGVMAFVVSGGIASKVGDEPERIFRAGEALVGAAGRDPSRLAQCQPNRAGDVARNLYRSAASDGR